MPEEGTRNYAGERAFQRELAGILLRQNVQFVWTEPVETWGGLNRNELSQLVGQVAEGIGLSPEQAGKITIYFGDKKALPEDEQDHLYVAQSARHFSVDDRVINCEIVLNRSRDLVLEELEGNINEPRNEAEEVEMQKYESLGVLHADTEDVDDIKCVFQTPRENIIWLLAEELHHAQLAIKAGTRARLAQWDRRYAMNLLAKGGQRRDLYAVKFEEVAALRVALQVLTKIYRESEPERAVYFQQLHAESLKSRKNVYPDITHVFNDTYI